MATQDLAWLLTALGVTGLWGAAAGRRWGWAVALAAQPLWIAYAFATKQIGFIPGCVVYGVADIRGLVRSPKRSRQTTIIHQESPLARSSSGKAA